MIPVRATSCTHWDGPHVFGCRLTSIGSRFVETEMSPRIISHNTKRQLFKSLCSDDLHITYCSGKNYYFFKVVFFGVSLHLYTICIHWCVFMSPSTQQEQLVKQGMKADQASSLVELTAAKCSTVKYDVELAEEYIARQVLFTLLTNTQCPCLRKNKPLINFFLL